MIDESLVNKTTDLVDAIDNSLGKFLIYIITILYSCFPRFFLCCQYIGFPWFIKHFLMLIQFLGHD